MRWMLVLALGGCSSTSFDVVGSTPTEDSSLDDSTARDSSAIDSRVADSIAFDSNVPDTHMTDAIAKDSIAFDTDVVDSALKDTFVADTIVMDAGGPACSAFWCGCGTCLASDIVCTRGTYACPLGCPASACPYTSDKTACSDDGTGCKRNLPGDQPCYTTADCPAGKCCDGTYAPPGHGKCGSC